MFNKLGPANIDLNNCNSSYLSVGSILTASILVCLPVLLYGVPSGNDLPQHYQFAQTVFDNLKSSDYYAGWTSSTNGGYGDVGLRFYPPLAYYVLAGFRGIAGNWGLASFLTFTFWFFVGGTGVYFLSREWFSENASLFGALVYMIMPYHVNEIYNAFTYAEFAASSILPFCFLFVTRVVRGGRSADVILLAASYALLILTHLPVAVITSIALLVYAVVSLEKTDRLRAIARLGVSVVVGLCASSFYWLRMVTELDFVNHTASQFTDSAYDFRSNFVLSFLYSSVNDESRSLWFCDLMLLASALFLIPGSIIFLKKADSSLRRQLTPIFVILILGIFMATPLSIPVWEHFATLQRIQFPWRWLCLVSLAGAAISAAGVSSLTSISDHYRRPVLLIVAGLSIAAGTFTAAQIIRPARYIPQTEFSVLMSRIATNESFECWMPVWANKKALAVREKVTGIDRQAAIEAWRPTERAVSFEAGNEQTARFATFWYPRWRAEVNGSPVELSRDENGAILIPIPAEKAVVKLWFQETPAFYISSWASGAAWIVILLVLGLGWLRRVHLRTKQPLFAHEEFSS